MAETKIATFNVNSVKSRLPVLESWLSSQEAPEIVCLQETKCRDTEFPVEFFKQLGYHSTFRGMKSYNGVAVLSRALPDEAEFGLCDEGEEGREESEEARVIRVRFGDLNLFNTYVPMGKEIDHPDYQYKLRFFSRLRALFEKKAPAGKNLLWVGDLNVAPTDIDVTHPENKKKHACFHEDVKKALSSVMEMGLVDIFRERLPEEGHFTYWDYRIKDALNRNIGWRLDHIIGTPDVASDCEAVTIARELRAMEKPSDHTAVTAAFNF